MMTTSSLLLVFSSSHHYLYVYRHVSVKEFKILLGLSTELSTILFKYFDDDNSGLLDIVEFLRGVTVLKLLGEPGTRMRTAFKLFDTNGDGTLDYKEFLHMLEVLHEYSSSVVRLNAKDNVDLYLSALNDNGDNVTVVANTVTMTTGKSTEGGAHKAELSLLDSREVDNGIPSPHHPNKRARREAIVGDIKIEDIQEEIELNKDAYKE